MLCQVLAKPRINFFVVIFSHKGLARAPEKIQALLQAPQPQSIAGIRSFLGMTNFSLHFLCNFSAITAQLQNLIKRNATFQWDKEAENLFSTICQSLTTRPVMAYLHPHRTTKLIVDEYRVFRYNSHRTTSQVQRYSQIEIESATVEFGVTQNDIYLYSLPRFTISIDHKPFIPLYKSYKTPDTRGAETCTTKPLKLSFS